MRIISLFCVLFIPLLARAEGETIPLGVRSPSGQVRLALSDLITRVADRKPSDLPYTFYFSFYVFDKEEREKFKPVFNAWCNHMNGSRGYIPFVEVPGSDGDLWSFRTTDCVNWTRAAWEIIGNRDYMMTELNVKHQDAQTLRLLTGTRQDEKTLAVVRVINAYQFFRDSLETVRSQTYKDALYGKERYPDEEPLFQLIPRVDKLPEPPKQPTPLRWPGDKPWSDGKVYPGGFDYIPFEVDQQYKKDLKAYEEKLKAIQADVIPTLTKPLKGNPKFPETGADAEKRWGAQIKADDLKTFLIDPRFGGIAKGTENDPKNGSIVRLNDAAIIIVRTPFGWSARTLDVKENTGDRDHFARLEQIVLGNGKADGGEILFSLPNGSQSGELVNAEDKTVDKADTELAQNRNQKIDKNVDVRNFVSCFLCHGATGGFIPFQEAVNESIKKGLQAKELDSDLARKVRDFYTAWDDQIISFQAPYKRFIAETTATKENPKGMTATVLIGELKRFRDKYDLPVTLDTAAAEFGVSKRELKTFLLNLNGDSPKIRESVKNRVNQLATEQAIPRRAWEVDVAKEIGILLNAATIQDEQLKRIISDQLLENAVKEFSKKFGGKK